MQIFRMDELFINGLKCNESNEERLLVKRIMCVYCKYGFGLVYYGRSQENLGIIEVREINPAFLI